MRHIITEEFLRRELDSCREKIDRLLPRFQDCFPAANTEGLVYPAEYENFEWTTSFLSGMLWLLYEPCPATPRSCCGKILGRRSASSRRPKRSAAATFPRRASSRPGATWRTRTTGGG